MINSALSLRDGRSLTDLPIKAILVVDVCGSTRLFHECGDQGARSEIGALLAEVGAAIAPEGTVVKYLGDGLFALLPNADLALLVCRRIRRLAQGSMLGLSMGLHFGPVIEEDGDAFGDAVNVAFRVAQFAARNQLTAIDDLIPHLPQHSIMLVSLMGAVLLQGKPDPNKLYDLMPLLEQI